MKFAVDAHAIGRHLTGNEVYIRNLLHCFASLDTESEFITYLIDGRSLALGTLPVYGAARFPLIHSNAWATSCRTT